MNSCFVANNTATYSGGVFSLFNVNLLVVNSSIYDNFAYVDGGILASTLAQSKFENNVISGNIAYRASCFFIDLESTVETVDNTILHNTVLFFCFSFNQSCNLVWCIDVDRVFLVGLHLSVVMGHGSHFRM